MNPLFMNIKYVIQHQYPHSNNEGGALHTDLTDHLIENVEVSTDTWPATVDELHCCLAKCQHHAVDIAKHKAHLATTDLELMQLPSQAMEPDYSSIYTSLQQPSFIHALRSELWKHIPKEFQEKLTTI